MNSKYLLALAYALAFDDPPADPPKDPPQDPPKDPPVGDAAKLLEEERAKFRKVQDGLTQEIEALKTRSQMTDQERQEQEHRLEELQNQLLTKEELAKKEIQKREREYKTSVETLTQERDTWKQRYAQDTIDRSLTEAAAENNAYNPRQIVSILRSNTELVENEGKFDVKVKLEDTNDKGDPITLELSPKQAVKHLSEKDDYLNLFKSDQNGGFGGRGPGSNNQADPAKLAQDPAAYRQARKEGKI